MGSTLGEILVREKVLNPEQLHSAQEFQRKHDVSLASAIIAQGMVSAEEMAQGLSRQLGYPYIDLDQFEVYPDVISLVTVDAAKKYMIMPIHRIRSFLTLAMVDPTDLDVIEDIRFRTGLSIQPVIASESGIMNAINKYYGASHAIKAKKAVEDIELADDSKITIIEEVKDDFDVEENEEPADEAPDHHPGQLHLRRGHQKGRQRRPFRALREILPHPLPHRRHPLRDDEPADEVQEPDPVAGQDHLQHEHRREAPAPGRPASRCGSSWTTARRRRWTCASPPCRRSSAKRSSPVSWTARTCRST